MSEREIIIPVSKIRSKIDGHSLASKLRAEAEAELDGVALESPVSTAKEMEVMSNGKISIKFPKFIQLVATHDFDEIMERHKYEDVLITSDLLVDLAGSTPVVEEVQESKFSWIFLGLMLGMVCASIVFLVFIN